jgi:protein gp37
MAENTKIQWTTHTFNPWRGCQKVAAGCANCYAEALSKRNSGTLGIWGPNGTRVLASESMWRQPLKWDRDAETTAEVWPEDRPRVFCASLADVFEGWDGILTNSRGDVINSRNWQPILSEGPKAATLDDARARLFRLIDDTPSLDWLLLTKRPENVRRMTTHVEWSACDSGDCPHERAADCDTEDERKRRDNVWLGTSVATQEDADKNIPELLKCRDLCAKLFVSAEPLVKPVDLRGVWSRCPTHDFPGGMCVGPCPDKQRIDWVIVGGESGPHARPCNVEWVRSIVWQCQDARVPCFIKQLGALCIDNDCESRCEWPGLTQFVEVTEGCKVRLRDPKGGDPSEWPDDLRVREVQT